MVCAAQLRVRVVGTLPVLLLPNAVIEDEQLYGPDRGR